jgi:peroxiredoxin Q/BCP
MLHEGDKAPSFTLPSDDGTLVSLSEFTGKKVVLYFYPKDDTPGCSREACAFRDAYEDFLSHNAVVIGVSADDMESHGKFRTKYDLPFFLLSDTRHEMIKKYGAWGEKTSGDKTKEGIIRATYLIDEDGIILKYFGKVIPDNHAEEILEYLEK